MAKAAQEESGRLLQFPAATPQSVSENTSVALTIELAMELSKVHFELLDDFGGVCARARALEEIYNEQVDDESPLHREVLGNFNLVRHQTKAAHQLDRFVMAAVSDLFADSAAAMRSKWIFEEYRLWKEHWVVDEVEQARLWFRVDGDPEEFELAHLLGVVDSPFVMELNLSQIGWEASIPISEVADFAQPRLEEIARGAKLYRSESSELGFARPVQVSLKRLKKKLEQGSLEVALKDVTASLKFARDCALLVDTLMEIAVFEPWRWKSRDEY